MTEVKKVKSSLIKYIEQRAKKVEILNITNLDFSKYNINATDNKKNNALMHIIEKKIKTTQEQFNYLIKNSDLNQLDNEENNALIKLLLLDRANISHLDYIVEKTDLDKCSKMNNPLLLTIQTGGSSYLPTEIINKMIAKVDIAKPIYMSTSLFEHMLINNPKSFSDDNKRFMLHKFFSLKEKFISASCLYFLNVFYRENQELVSQKTWSDYFIAAFLQRKEPIERKMFEVLWGVVENKEFLFQCIAENEKENLDYQHYQEEIIKREKNKIGESLSISLKKIDIPHKI